MNSLEGANCAGLPGFVIDKYFDCDAGREPLRRMVALAICNNCAVLELCREQALNGPPVLRGVIGGVSAYQLKIARQWRAYELGITESVPRRPRPGWLAMTDATQVVEQGRLEVDPDEAAELK